VVQWASNVSSVDPLIGLKLNEYEVLEAVAEGGMGVVYRGVHPVIGKRVAIKVLKAGTEKRGSTEAQLAAEAKAVNAIAHRNIVDIFGMGNLPDGRRYIIMEYLEGQALDACAAERTLPLIEIVQILYDMCAPLGAAHAAKIIHRDLKPSNVFLCKQPDGSTFLKLLDFGLAKQSYSLDGVTEQTSKATVAGTPDFMAPEQAQGKAISPRTDLYALGCIGYVLTTGQLPFLGQTPFDVMVAHVRQPVPRASAKKPDLPPALDELLFRLMQKKPDDRPPSADAVRDALFPILEQLGAAAGAEAEKATRTGPRPSLSGEFVVRQARASGARLAQQAAILETDNNGVVPAPAPVVPAPAHIAPPSRARWMVGALVVAIVILAGAVALTGEQKDSPARTVPTRRAEPTPVEVARVDPPTPAAEPVAPEPPDLPEEDLTPLNELTAPAKVAPRKPEARAPTEAELKSRLTSLEAKLRKATADAPDPAALQYLSKYRVQATMADSPAARLKVAGQLDHWEKLFLKR